MMPFDGHGLLPEQPFPSYEAYQRATGPSSAVEKARRMTPTAVLDEVRRSGLRGRGGAGFPTGTKWSTLATHPCPTRYVVCNLAEGEPGTFKDRYLLRRNPYATLEGLLIAVHAIGAKEIYIAAKASFVKELGALRRAIQEMADVIGDVPIHIVEGPDEYLFGEEKALLNVIEGEGPLPREAHYPPYELGLFATPNSPNPALVHNAQTLAHVASIIRHGADTFQKLGTSDTPGTLLVTLSGAVKRPGVYEIEAGVPFRKLLDEQGQGTLGAPKAVLSGVASGVLLPRRFDVPVEFGSFAMAGTGLGSAGFIVIGESTSMPRVAQTVGRFLYVESCNQCSACKQGLGLASSAIDELFDPEKASNDDWERALLSARGAPQGNRCYLPVQGSILLPSLLQHFKTEFEAQLANPGRETAPWTLPKIVDFDEATHRFTYDDSQAAKQPDWTYLPTYPADEAARPSTKRPMVEAPKKKPSTTPDGRSPIYLPPDLARAFTERAQAAGIPFDRQVETALREWLARPPRPSR